ncbi:hypothetical protein KR222_008631 [Zaprionus bogoriensis]|nr:hypothetical protein KR222_008631 [Zaprionus bogoriensis]
MGRTTVVARYAQLTPQQRRVADSLIVCICRGSYTKALLELDNRGGVLPAKQEQAVRQLLERLRHEPKTNSLRDCEALVLELQLPALDAGVIDSMNTHMPRPLLGDIYELLLRQDYPQFRQQLQHLQWVEHTVVRHTFILYAHCTRLKAAQRALDRLQCDTGSQTQLCLLYTLILSVGLYLFSFFL